MKLIFCLAVGLILCNLVATIESEKDFVRDAIDHEKDSLGKRVRGDSLFESISRLFGKGSKKTNNESTNDENGKSKITDLDEDCLFMILDRLELIDLLSIAEVNDDFSQFASAVYRHKFSYLEVVIEDSYTIPSKPLLIGRLFQRLGIIDKKETKRSLYISPTAIDIYDYDLLVSIFTHFGHVIKKISILPGLSRKQSKDKFIGEIIGKYTSEELVEIAFHTSNESLTYITKPLSSVEMVTFKLFSLDTHPKGLPFNKLFPAVRRVEFDRLEGAGLSYFNCHMPHLEYVSIGGGDVRSDSSFTDFIRNNTQIRNIKISINNFEFLNKVSILLPQLERISLPYLGPLESNGLIRFDSVTTFGSDEDESGSPKGLYFPRLHKLYIKEFFFTSRLHEWIDFLREHKHLSHLHLEGNMDDYEFEQLTANLPSLTEMTLIWGLKSSLRIQPVVEFLNNHGNVKKFTFWNFPEYKAALCQQLKHEWDIKTVNNYMISTRR